VKFEADQFTRSLEVVPISTLIHQDFKVHFNKFSTVNALELTCALIPIVISLYKISCQIKNRPRKYEIVFIPFAYCPGVESPAGVLTPLVGSPGLFFFFRLFGITAGLTL
jgi:hypothetical protein